MQFLRESEIRTWLRSHALAERMAKYLLAVQQDEAETIRAFRLAPGEPLIPDDIRQRADHDRLASTKPKEMGRLRSLEVVREQLYELSDTLLGWLQGYGATLDVTTPSLRSAQYLLGYGGEVKFPVPNVNPAMNLT